MRTFHIVVSGSERVLMSHKAKADDIYRSCQTKGAPIKNWVKLAARRCRCEDAGAKMLCKAIF